MNEQYSNNEESEPTQLSPVEALGEGMTLAEALEQATDALHRASKSATELSNRS